MPSFVFVQQSAFGTSEVEGKLCDPGPLGYPNRRTDTPVKVRLISEQTLCIDNEPRAIVSRQDGNGTIKFLIAGGKGVHNRARRQQLEQATALKAIARRRRAAHRWKRRGHRCTVARNF